MQPPPCGQRAALCKMYLQICRLCALEFRLTVLKSRNTQKIAIHCRPYRPYALTDKLNQFGQEARALLEVRQLYVYQQQHKRQGKHSFPQGQTQ